MELLTAPHGPQTHATLMGCGGEGGVNELHLCRRGKCHSENLKKGYFPLFPGCATPKAAVPLPICISSYATDTCKSIICVK